MRETRLKADSIFANEVKDSKQNFSRRENSRVAENFNRMILGGSRIIEYDRLFFYVCFILSIYWS
jgi:hypothetical protein